MRFTTLKKSTKIFKNFVNQYNPHSAPIPIPPAVRNYGFQGDILTTRPSYSYLRVLCASVVRSMALNHLVIPSAKVLAIFRCA